MAEQSAPTDEPELARDAGRVSAVDRERRLLLGRLGKAAVVPTVLAALVGTPKPAAAC